MPWTWGSSYVSTAARLRLAVLADGLDPWRYLGRGRGAGAGWGWDYTWELLKRYVFFNRLFDGFMELSGKLSLPSFSTFQ
jgi:hypothetical protein